MVYGVLDPASNSAHAQNRKLAIRDGGKRFWPAVSLYLFCWGVFSSLLFSSQIGHGGIILPTSAAIFTWHVS